MPDEVNNQAAVNTNGVVGDTNAGSQTDTSQDTSGHADQPSGDVIVEYEQKLMEEIGLNNLPPEEKKMAEEKLEDLINNRIINLMMVCIPEDKLNEAKPIIEEGDPNKISDFMQNNIENWGDKVMSELLQLRNDLLTSNNNG